MERAIIIQGLTRELESLTRLHIQYGLFHTAGFQAQKESIENYIREHQIELKLELDPLAMNLYRRYFG